MTATDPLFSKRIEMMEKQLSLMNEYLKNQSGKSEPIVKNAVKNEEINRLKYILQDYAKLNFELVTNVIKFFKKRLEVMR